MKARIHILEQSSRLAQFVEKIETAAQNAIKKIEEKIELPALDIVIGDNPDSAIPETGIGGFSPNQHLIFVWIDPTFKGLEGTIGEKVMRTITHESHHAARSLIFPWAEANLLEAFVTEGLADHFDIEINSGKPYPWSIALTAQEVSEYFEKAKESKLLSKDYDHSSWFFGSKDKNIPRWTGYAIGYKIVGDYLQKTGKKASELVDTPARDFIQ